MNIWLICTIIFVLLFTWISSCSYSFWWSFYVLENNNNGDCVPTLCGKCGLLDPGYDHSVWSSWQSIISSSSIKLKHVVPHSNSLITKRFFPSASWIPLFNQINIDRGWYPYAAKAKAIQCFWWNPKTSVFLPINDDSYIWHMIHITWVKVMYSNSEFPKKPFFRGACPG